jgi:hypothetical protein
VDDDFEATRAALREYEKSGSDLSRPMAMDFFVIAPSQAVARVVQVRTAPMGFTTTVGQDDEGRWICTCSVTLVPELEKVVALEQLLDRLAHELGGFADGFGSYGNAQG